MNNSEGKEENEGNFADLKLSSSMAGVAGGAEHSWNPMAALKYLKTVLGRLEAANSKNGGGKRGEQSVNAPIMFLSTYLVEVYLCCLSFLEESDPISAGNAISALASADSARSYLDWAIKPASSSSALSGALFEKKREQNPFTDMLIEFVAFLVIHQQAIHRATCSSLLAAHGQMELMALYGLLCNDPAAVVEQLIQRGEHQKAMQVITEQMHTGRRSEELQELVVRFSSDLIQKCPVRLVSIWSEKKIPLSSILPAMARFDPSGWTPSEQHLLAGKENIILNFLEREIAAQRCKDVNVNNFMILLYARARLEDKLIHFMLTSTSSEENSYGTFNLDTFSPCFSKSYALRVCLQEGLKKAATFAYLFVALIDEAFNTALNGVSAEFAEEVFVMIRNTLSIDVQKRIWLKIVRFSTKLENLERMTPTEKTALVKKILDKSREIENLQISKVLPLLPSALIPLSDVSDYLLDSITKCEEDHKKLRAEMADNAIQFETLDSEIKEEGIQPAIIVPSSECPICHLPLIRPSSLTHSTPPPPLLTFSCGHSFHICCATNYLFKTLPLDRREELYSCRQKMMGVSDHIAAQELWGQMTGDFGDCCPLCGDNALAAINQSLLIPAPYEAEEWSLEVAQ